MEKYTQCSTHSFKIPPRSLYGISCIHKSDGKPLTLYQLTPCSRPFLGKLILGHLVQKETALTVAASSARSASCSQWSKQELDRKKSEIFCTWYFARRNKGHVPSRALLCNARRGDLFLVGEAAWVWNWQLTFI